MAVVITASLPSAVRNKNNVCSVIVILKKMGGWHNAQRCQIIMCDNIQLKQIEFEREKQIKGNSNNHFKEIDLWWGAGTHVCCLVGKPQQRDKLQQSVFAGER